MTVIDCNDKIINVKTNDSLKVIRVISYIIFKDKQFEVIESNKFTENTFEMKLKDDIKFEPGDNFIGVKIAQPRSYLSTEPAVLRANKNNFDSVEQCWDRAYTLQRCGHPVDKIEIIVLGGTWSHYPKEYQREFIRDTYYAMNTFPEHLKNIIEEGIKIQYRKRLSLEEEIIINHTAQCRIIGLTLETRPDCINKREIKLLENIMLPEYN